MLSAASTARRAVSTVCVCSATARTLASTYSASFKMYSGSEPRRLYAWSKISTRTLWLLASLTGVCLVAVAMAGCTPLAGHDVGRFLARSLLLGQSFDLRQHFFHAAANLFALLAQTHHLAAHGV